MMEKEQRTKNKRLSQYDRTRLLELAKKRVTESADADARDAAYHAAAEAIRAEVEKQFPPKDMKVLARYDAASPDKCIYVSRGYGDRDRFCFREGDKIPMRPSNGGCGYRTFLLEGPAIEALDAYKDAEKAFEDGITQRFSDYKALICTVNTFNEVASVWPEAEELREAVVGSATALVVLNNDIVKRIQSDAAHRLDAA